MADTYPVHGTGPRDPAIGAVAIDYSGGDQTVTRPVRGVHCNTAGNLKVDMADGTTATFAMNAGSLYPYCVIKVYQTGSTAAGVLLV